MENCIKTVSVLQTFLGDKPPDPLVEKALWPHVATGSRGHWQKLGLKLDPLHAKNEFCCKGNESIKLTFP